MRAQRPLHLQSEFFHTYDDSIMPIDFAIAKGYSKETP